MRLQTILTRVEKFKSLVYGEARLEEQEDGPALLVEMRPRKNGQPHCSGCGRRGRTYDRLEERRFEFVPLRWGGWPCCGATPGGVSIASGAA